MAQSETKTPSDTLRDATVRTVFLGVLMTTSYWLKIAAGALAIFMVGMVLVGMGRRGTEWVDNVAHSASTISIPIVFVPFRFDGTEIGSIKRLNILRDSPHQVTGAEVAVRLRDGAQLPVEGCALTVDDLEKVAESGTFYCASSEARSAGDLIPFGTVTFEPEGATRTLLIPRTIVEELRQELEGDAGAPQVALHQRKVERRVEAQAARAQELAIQASETGVRISIISALEEAGVLLRADSDGAALSLYDKASGDAVVMRADSNGFVMSVKEDGEGRLQMRADSNGLQLHVTDAAGTSRAGP